MKNTLIACALALAFGTAAFCVQAADTKCGPKDAVFMVDYSGSMMESFNKDEEANDEFAKKQKEARAAGTEVPVRSEEDEAYDGLKRITFAKELLGRISASRSFDAAKTGLYTAAPFTAPVPLDRISADSFNAAEARILENLEVLGRRTPLGIAFADLSRDMTEIKADPAVILFTNGEVNRGRDPVEALKQFYTEHPGSCVSFVSFADTDKGRQDIAALAALKPCSKVIEARAVFKDEKAFPKFIDEVLAGKCEDTVLEINGINFAHDSYAIDAKSEAILQKALKYLEADKRDVEINGWTDYNGSDAYNMVLSLNRAKAVRSWLIAHGVDAKRLTVKGNGKSFKYDNKTAEGRYQNRRMDFRFHGE
jgi:OOP family OmpA-OmpF porin